MTREIVSSHENMKETISFDHATTVMICLSSKPSEIFPVTDASSLASESAKTLSPELEVSCVPRV